MIHEILRRQKALINTLEQEKLIAVEAESFPLEMAINLARTVVVEIEKYIYIKSPTKQLSKGKLQKTYIT